MVIPVEGRDTAAGIGRCCDQVWRAMGLLSEGILMTWGPPAQDRHSWARNQVLRWLCPRSAHPCLLGSHLWGHIPFPWIRGFLFFLQWSFKLQANERRLWRRDGSSLWLLRLEARQGWFHHCPGSVLGTCSLHHQFVSGWQLSRHTSGFTSCYSITVSINQHLGCSHNIANA